MKEVQFGEKISGQIKTLITGRSIWLVCPGSEDYHEAIELLLRELVTRHNKTGIYITLSKQYLTFHEHLKTVGIDVSKLYFIYCNGKKMEKLCELANCVFISSPKSLTELSLAVINALNLGKFDFLFFDSISELLEYNGPELTEKFVNYLAAKLRDYGLAGIAISLKGDAESAKLSPFLSRLCDKVIA